MSSRITKSEQNLLQLSSEWIYYPLDLQLEIAGRLLKRKVIKMSRPIKALLAILVVGGLAAITAVTIVELTQLSEQSIVWGAWMFLLGALLTAVVILLNRR